MKWKFILTLSALRASLPERERKANGKSIATRHGLRLYRKALTNF
jgi:hypothetical protein